MLSAEWNCADDLTTNKCARFVCESTTSDVIGTTSPSGFFATQHKTLPCAVCYIYIYTLEGVVCTYTLHTLMSHIIYFVYVVHGTPNIVSLVMWLNTSSFYLLVPHKPPMNHPPRERHPVHMLYTRSKIDNNDTIIHPCCGVSIEFSTLFSCSMLFKLRVQHLTFNEFDLLILQTS